MGPGRLTGMNGPADPASRTGRRRASMRPGRLTGMNGGLRALRAHSGTASMGPGRLTGMNASLPTVSRVGPVMLQWGPVD